MTTLLKPIHVRKELLDRNARIFTPLTFSRLFHLPDYRTKYFLEKQAKEGLFLRLKQGLYGLQTDPPSEEEIANALYKPSYISFEYALSLYGIMPERPYTITSATTKSTVEFYIQEKPFAYYTIKKKAYTGYHLVRKEAKSYLIADPEKALADYLYFVSLGKKGANDRLYTKDLNREKLISYAKLFERKSLDEYVAKIYDNS
jgi:predicted transcriptional regulator of viral defense system